MLKIVFKDVGQGDCSLLVGPNGSVALIDCNFSAESDLEWLFEFIPKQANGDRILHYLILTHPHEDHIRGIRFVGNTFKIQEVLESGHRLYIEAADKEKYTHYYDMLNLIQRIKQNGGVHHQVKAGELNAFPVEPDLSLEVLAPTRAYLDSEKPSERDIHTQCGVFRVLYKGRSVLFCGDSNLEAWTDYILPDLKKNKKSVESNLLHVSHHSSYTFFKPEGKRDEEPVLKHIKAISPLVSIVSVGRMNRYNHPDKDALEIYKNETRHNQVFLTMNHGSIFANIDSSGYLTILTERMQQAIKQANQIPLSIDVAPKPWPDGQYPKDVQLTFTAETTQSARVKRYRFTVQNNSIPPDDRHDWYEGQSGPSRVYRNTTKYFGKHILLCEAFNERNATIATAHVEISVR